MTGKRGGSEHSSQQQRHKVCPPRPLGHYPVTGLKSSVPLWLSPNVLLFAADFVKIRYFVRQWVFYKWKLQRDGPLRWNEVPHVKHLVQCGTSQHCPGGSCYRLCHFSHLAFTTTEADFPRVSSRGQGDRALHERRRGSSGEP